MSNRSSRFVHPLQSLTSVLAGGPRRLMALAAVLALLVLALLPTTGQAQSDTTPPALESATVAADGTTITLVFDEAFEQNAAFGLSATDFPVTADGSTVTVGSFGFVDEGGVIVVYRTILLEELSPAITHGQVVTVSYIDPTTSDDTTAVLEDAAGNDVASFTTGSGGVPAVVNNVPAPTQYIRGEIWSTTLTVKELSAGVSSGCRNAVTGKECSTLLDDDDFTYNGKTYQIVELQFAGDDLIIEFGIAPGDDVNSFELNADGRIYSFQNATMVTPEYFSIPLPASVPFTVDTVVMLSMTVPVETTPVPPTWSLVPSGLDDGDSFRLLFIGTNGRDASSSDISVYNTFLQNQVETNGHADIQAHSATFRMLGSTEDVDARDNTGTTGTGVPIYWLNGAKVADDYADFYDGSWDEEATGRRETGASVSIGTDWKIWTGSAQDGTEAMSTGATPTSRALGNSNNAWVMQGSPNGSDSAHGPIASNTANRTGTNGLYGLSGVFTVDASLDADTTPPSLESATVLADGATIELVFDEYYDRVSAGSFSTVAPFSVTADGSSVTVGSLKIINEVVGGSIVGSRVFQLANLSPAIEYGQVVTASYTDPTTGDDTGAVIQDVAGNDVASFTTGLDGVPAVVNNVPNNPPMFQQESTTREVEENSPAGTDVGLPVTATDADDDTLTYTLEGTDAASFEIDATSGQIQTKSGVTYDYEMKEEYSVTVKADDGNGGTATIAVAIDLLDVDETVATPGAPRNVAATAGTGKVTLTWMRRNRKAAAPSPAMSTSARRAAGATAAGRPRRR